MCSTPISHDSSLDKRDQLSRDGFLVIRNFLPPPSLPPLRTAASLATSLARSGKWPHLRTLPKQFPPWSSDPSHGIWGVQHILHPDLPGHKLFASTYFSDQLVGTATDILGCGEEDLVMELCNMLVTPDHDFELRWHRDDVPHTASAEEEERRLGGDRDGRRRMYSHAQWNIPLYDDDCLVVVPGSHRRAKTEAERSAQPYEKHLEGMQVVELKAGDAVFYDHNIFHRGVYRAGEPRATLHGTVGSVGPTEDRAKIRERARVILQHGVGDWVRRTSFEGLQPRGLAQRAERMRKRLIELDDSRGGEAVEFSLEG